MLRQGLNTKIILPLTAMFGALAVTANVSQAPAKPLGPLPEQFATTAHRPATPHAPVVSADNVCEQGYKIVGMIAAHSGDWAGAKVRHTDQGEPYCQIEVTDPYALTHETRIVRLYPGMTITDEMFLPIQTPGVQDAMIKERDVILERFAQQLAR